MTDTVRYSTLVPDLSLIVGSDGATSLAACIAKVLALINKYAQ